MGSGTRWDEHVPRSLPPLNHPAGSGVLERGREGRDCKCPSLQWGVCVHKAFAQGHGAALNPGQSTGTQGAECWVLVLSAGQVPACSFCRGASAVTVVCGILWLNWDVWEVSCYIHHRFPSLPALHSHPCGRGRLSPMLPTALTTVTLKM